MSRCVIITSYIEGKLSDFLQLRPSDFVICADGGYAHAKNAGIVPDLMMGDFDSLSEALPQDIEIRTFPAEKDDTDTGLCVKTAISMGYDEILIAGGLGGRFDHSVANIQTLASAAESASSVSIIDGHNFATVLTGAPGKEISVKKRPGCYLSLFSLSDVCLGVCISGVRYPLSDHTLTNKFPLGVSNEFRDDAAVISVSRGTLLIVLSSE